MYFGNSEEIKKMLENLENFKKDVWYGHWSTQKKFIWNFLDLLKLWLPQYSIQLKEGRKTHEKIKNTYYLPFPYCSYVVITTYNQL